MGNYDDILTTMRAARDRQDLLIDDLTIAHYKGYGSTGGTAEDINEEIDQLETYLETLQVALDELDR